MTSLDLTALDAALAGEPGADPDLLLFVDDVRATREPLSLSLKTRLEADLAAGFPKPAKRRFSLVQWTGPALAVAAMGLIALVVVFSSGGGGSSDDSSSGSQADVGAASTAASAVPQLERKSAAPAPTAAGAASSSAAVAPAPAAPSQPRKVERNIDLTLRVAAGKLQTASDGVARATEQLGGYVQSSDVSANGSSGEAEFTLRVPSAKLDEAIKRLGGLGHTARMDQSARDITSSFVSVQDQLHDARAERSALLKALGKATTPERISTLRARIADNRSTIARYKGQLDALRRRADLSTIQLHVVAHGKEQVVPVSSGKHRWGPGSAAHDALRVLEVSAGIALIALAVLVPLGLLGGLALFGGRGVRRRRRESALDTA